MHPKVLAAGTGAAVGDTLGANLMTIVVWALSLHGCAIPQNVQEALVGLITVAVTFWAGWAMPSSKPEATSA